MSLARRPNRPLFCGTTFRFDDVCPNTDPVKLEAMVEAALRAAPNATIVFAVSPLVHDMPDTDGAQTMERVFPSMLHVESDPRAFYKVGPASLAGAARVLQMCKLAHWVHSHGLVHVDHRLMTRSAQELSIVASCSLLDTSVFVPPFHKWNEKTEDVCREHGITLVKHDSSMRHLKFHRLHEPVPEGTIGGRTYYLHTHDFADADEFAARLA